MVHPAFAQTDHRPWPVPDRPWAWRQSWLDLAFIHFEANPAELRRRIPGGLELELFEGRAWVGIVPFRMEGVTKRGWPAPASICDFPEINVRTYVTDGRKPGAPAPARPGSFCHWATERYCLYSATAGGRCYRAEVQHSQWPLQEARLEMKTNTLADFQLGPRHPTVLFSRKIEVVLWPLEPVA